MGRAVSVVLITWNSARYLLRCAEGVASQSHRELDLVVIDNASSDNSLALARSLFPGAMFVRNQTNIGFSAAANQGIAASRADFVLLLNPDVYLEPNYVSVLVAALEKAGNRTGSATGKLLRGLGDAIVRTGVVDSKGIRMTRNGRHFDLCAGELDREGDAVAEVFGVSGAAALHRRSMLEDVAEEGQVLDEDFFAYREDADLAWRAQLRGWKSLYVPEARAYHVRRVTPEARSTLSPEINMHSVKNRFLLRLKNQGTTLALRDALFTIPRDLVVLGAALAIERSSLPGLAWILRNRKRIAAKRRAIQARRIVSDRQLAKWFV